MVMADNFDGKEIPLGQGVRNLRLNDIAPDCELLVGKGAIYNLGDLARNSVVLDVGCGHGRNQKLVKSVSGYWVGLEKYSGGGVEIVKSDAQLMPFQDGTFDIVIADAVLEHIPDPGLAFAEISRVLKPGGFFIGYVAFMECSHEISYCHLSFKALEYFSNKNDMKLEKISGGQSFGIDYHISVLLYPIPTRYLRIFIAYVIRGLIRAKAYVAYLLLSGRYHDTNQAVEKAELYYKIECLRQSTGFSFLIRKNRQCLKKI